MSATAAAVLVDWLVACKVEILFGLPGDGIKRIIEALRQRRCEGAPVLACEAVRELV